MNRCLLLILLSSWAHVVPLSLQCETGVAYPNHVLSIPRSLMANADVGLLKTYHAENLDKCITECCAEKFGSCSVASFKKNNVTEENCQHFNCRPVNKCKFLSSNSTDSFSFSSSSTPHIIVPSRQTSKNDSSTSTVASVTTESKPELVQNKDEHAVTTESGFIYSKEQFALKNDNTTVKARKGVDAMTQNSFENVSRSGVKPRKGVSLDGLAVLNNTKSKVKPRKGVGPYQSISISSSDVSPELILYPTVSTSPSGSVSLSASNSYENIAADDLVSALERVFEDDSSLNHIKPSAVSSIETVIKSTALPSSAPYVPTFTPAASSVLTSTSLDKTSSSTLRSSLETSFIVSSSVNTPALVTAPIQATSIVSRYVSPSPGSPSIVEHSKILFHEISLGDDKKYGVSDESEDAAESENERKYKSSMHLVLSLVFGLLVLFSVLGVIAKRIYDNWLRRHYRRMDFLIDGMYNGYE